MEVGSKQLNIVTDSPGNRTGMADIPEITTDISTCSASLSHELCDAVNPEENHEKEVDSIDKMKMLNPVLGEPSCVEASQEGTVEPGMNLKCESRESTTHVSIPIESAKTNEEASSEQSRMFIQIPNANDSPTIGQLQENHKQASDTNESPVSTKDDGKTKDSCSVSSEISLDVIYTANSQEIAANTVDNNVSAIADSYRSGNIRDLDVLQEYDNLAYEEEVPGNNEGFKRRRQSRRSKHAHKESKDSIRDAEEPLSIRRLRRKGRRTSKIRGNGVDNITVFLIMKTFTRFGKHIVDGLKIWRPLVRKVDSRFGPSGVAVFNFILDLIFLNCLLSVIMLGCVVLPTLFLQESKSSEEWFYSWNETETVTEGGQGDDVCTNVLLTSDDPLVMNCSLSYIQSTGTVWCKDIFFNNTITECDDITWWLAVLLQGQGIMELSPMFLGYYPALLTKVGYPVAAMQVVGVVVALFVSLVKVAKRVGGWLRYNADVWGGITFSRVVFSGWNFSLTSNHAVVSMQHIMKTELLAVLDEVAFQETKATRTRGHNVLLYLSRIFVNAVIVVLIIVNWMIICAIILSQSKWAEWVDSLDDNWGKISLRFFVDFADTFLVWLLGLLMPPILLRLGSLEQCNSRTTLLLYILRASAIRLASLAVLVMTHLSLVYERADDCRPEIPCWETHLGQNLYAQLVWAFLVRCIFALLCLAYRILMQPCVCCKLSVLPNYDVPDKVLDILSLQTLCWLGISVSPLMPVLALIYLVVLFFLELVDALFITQPSKHVFQASRSSSMFMVAMAVSWVGAASMAVTVLVFIPSSPGCGPFRGIKAPWTTLTHTICDLADPFRYVLFALDDVRISVVLLVILMCVAAYYLMLLNVRRDVIRRFEDRLKEASADRAFLKMKHESSGE